MKIVKMVFKNLLDYGIDDYLLMNQKNVKIGRVISQYNQLYRVVIEHGEMLTEVHENFGYNTKKFKYLL